MSSFGRTFLTGALFVFRLPILIRHYNRKTVHCPSPSNGGKIYYATSKLDIILQQNITHHLRTFLGRRLGGESLGYRWIKRHFEPKDYSSSFPIEGKETPSQRAIQMMDVMSRYEPCLAIPKKGP